MSMERLQKVLARAGVGARRACEDLILEGRVKVNGRVVWELGSRVDPETDRIEVDGLAIELPAEHRYIALYKPVNVVSTVHDPQGRRTVLDLVDVDTRVYPVGRLDYDSEGLLLLTNDGDLAYRLTHPSFEVEKEYRVLLNRPPTVEALRRWRAGVELEEGKTAPAWVEVLELVPEGAWVRVVLHEGRKRQIRRVAQLLGMKALRLIRVREGGIVLGALKPGQWRELTKKEVAGLDQHAPRTAPERRERTYNRQGGEGQQRSPDKRKHLDNRGGQSGWQQRQQTDQESSRAKDDDASKRKTRAHHNRRRLTGKRIKER